jgi:type IV pilus assembly protein PilM
MAQINSVWGIDIGQCALKALECRPHEKDDRQLVVESFDYIEYPKILTQPEADPVELIRDALQQFLSRNDLGGSRVAISVAGQSGLARFIKLPPVESKKIPDIVKYEARQQIPFSLEDVVWDYQQLRGGSEEDGFALEPEVGLFAMKRDQVARALAPLEDAGIEVEYIQLAPLAVYNYVCFDRLEDFSEQPYDPVAPPPSTVVISLGTDTTDLVVTNGFRVWQRNIPIGGNHFTRALSKELKLTFVKAEHLKRNAMQADDPRAVFQAMRPVFSDLLAEIQRSLGYFMSIDKTAKIGDVIALGNAMKLPGLQRYLAQNLEQEVRPIESFNRLSAGSAAANSQFKENLLSFAPTYGLCVQALGKAELRTNLLPEEIVRTRLIRAKKPWAVAGVAALLAGLSFNYLSHVSVWQGANVEREEFRNAISRASSTNSTLTGFESERTTIRSAAEQILAAQEALTSNVEGRRKWLELTKALAATLPQDDRPREETAEHVMDRKELHITSVDTQRFEDLAGEYFSIVEEKYWESKGGRPGEGAEGGDPMAGGDAMGGADPMGGGGMDSAEGEAGGDLAGPGWVIQLTGHHYHNNDKRNFTSRFVENTLIKNLETMTVELPDGRLPNGELGAMVEVPLKDVGISHAWVVDGKPLVDEAIDPDAATRGGATPGAFGGGFGEGGFGASGGFGEGGLGREGGFGEGGVAGVEQPVSRVFKVKRYDFVVQFCWRPTTRAERIELAEARQEAERLAAEEAANAPESDVEEDFEEPEFEEEGFEEEGVEAEGFEEPPVDEDPQA